MAEGEVPETEAHEVCRQKGLKSDQSREETQSEAGDGQPWRKDVGKRGRRCEIECCWAQPRFVQS